MKNFLFTLLFSFMALYSYAQSPDTMNLETAQDKDHTVDCLIVYDNSRKDFLEQEGGEEAYAQKVVESITEVMHNSGLDYSIRLVGVLHQYWNAPDVLAGLEKVMYEPEVIQKRKELKADIVVLLSEPWGDANSGVANQKARRWDAFASIKASMAVSSYTAAHEVGHILGACHSRSPEDQAPSDHPWAAAYISPAPECYLSVLNNMASGELVPVYSGPDVIWKGVTMGSPIHDNVRMLRSTLPKAVKFGEYLEDDRYYVSEEQIKLDHQAQSHEFTVYSSSFFKLECSPTSWMSDLKEVETEPMNGFYLQDGTFSFIVEPNLTDKERTATIRIYGDDNNKEITLTIKQMPQDTDTGINDREISSDESPAIYDLNGIRMNQPKGKLPEGIYIINGEKKIVK